MARKKITGKMNLDARLDEDHEENQAAENAESIAMKPTNRLEAITMAVNLMGIMPEDMVINAFDQMVQQMQYSGENIPPGWAAKNAADMQMKPSAATGVSESVKLGLAGLFNTDQNLSEDFRQKAETLFEAALSARMAVERETIKSQLDEENEEYLSEAMENLVDNVDQYLTYVAEEWVRENQVAIEPALRTEMTEDFIAGLKDLFDQHYIEIPDEKIDVVDDLAQKLQESEERLNKLMKENLELWKHNQELYKQDLVNEMTDGLALSQREKLRKLVEDFEVDDNLVDKINIVKEKHFGIRAPKESNLLEEGIDPQIEVTGVDPSVKKYANFASLLKNR